MNQMNIQYWGDNMTDMELETKLLLYKGSVKEFPFGAKVAVYKVMNKMFALVGTKNGVININLKCQPDDALGYRDIYECVIPGYHMNKKHWNTIIMNGEMKDEILLDMMDESYELIISKLTKKKKVELELIS